MMATWTTASSRTTTTRDKWIVGAGCFELGLVPAATLAIQGLYTGRQEVASMSAWLGGWPLG